MEKKVGVKQPVGQKLRREREDADNTLRQNRQKAAKKPEGDAGKKKAQRKLIQAEAKKYKKKLHFLDPEGKKAPGSAKNPATTARTMTHTPAAAVSGKLHQAINSNNEDRNVGVDAAHFTEGTAEGTVHTADHMVYSHKLKKYSKAQKLGAKADKANVDAMFQEAIQDNPGAASNPFSRWRQRQEIKKQYAAMKAGQDAAHTKGSTRFTDTLKETGERLLQFVKNHSHIIILMLCAGLMVLVISGMVSSCSMMMNSMGNAILGTSFTAEDEDLQGADADYEVLETALRNRIDNIESEYPGYDEYRYNLAEIGHNPYELAALLTVEFENYTRSQVQAELQRIFGEQYELTIEEAVEIRTRIVDSSYTDPETGETVDDSYEEEYKYYILNVTLTNTGIGVVARGSGLTDDQLERYDVLMETRGNRDDLFGDVNFAVPGSEYLDYDIPGEALTDEKFRRMITEAEKYLGYPYVWGGSSPSTSFDCSGFVSWVINHSGNGWNVGRSTANGLMGYCDIIRKSEARPGDLIFFQGTYNTSGASHVGIYVGDGMMIHCGNPISYASIETSYWQQHYYCMGRIR